jgi:hypothetical protein
MQKMLHPDETCGNQALPLSLVAQATKAEPIEAITCAEHTVTAPIVVKRKPNPATHIPSSHPSTHLIVVEVCLCLACFAR